MQLIFDTETEACIDKKMAFIDKESINEKFTADNIVEKLSNSISNGSGNKENIGKVDNIVVDNYTENNGIDSPKKSEVNGQNELSVNEEISTPVVDTASSQTAESESIENITDKRKDEECIENASDIDNTIEQSNNIDDVNIHTDNDLKNNLEHEDLSNGNVLEIQADENICSEEKHEKNTIIGESDTLNPADCSQMDSDDHKTEINPESDVNTVENQDEILESSSKKNEEINVEDTLKSDQGDGNIISFLFYKTKTDTIATENGLNTSNSNKEVMISNDKKTFCEEEHAETESQVTSSKDTEANSEKMDIDLIKEGDSEMSNELKDDHEDMKECENPVEIENPNDAESNRSSNIPTLQEEKTEKEKPCNLVETESKPESHLEKQNEPKKIYTKSKLSLDILSDDEDTVSSSDIKLEKTIEPNKQCINIEDDDDDIMLIDDENSTKPENEMGVTKIVNEHNEAIIESKDGNILEDKKEESSNNTPTNDQDIPLNESKIDVKKLDSDIIDKEENKEKISSPKPLLPTNFVSTCKKNLAEMTRSDLEEFCILKIVESVVDRGNLGEIKSQLKKMSQNIEEYKNKTKMLTKQNHALQVVLKSVQEELKKNTNAPIIPLKISRSVGIQVLMSEKNKKKTNNSTVTTLNNVSSPSPVNKPIRGLPPQIIRSPKPSQQNIPVPRLIPANAVVKSNTTATNQISTANNKTIINNATPAAKKSPAQRPEKRPLVKIPNDTVDLTDDEPPPKVISRPTNSQSVRLVPSQNLLSPQRPQLGTLINSPRKVYIPISGGQGQNARPNQTFMLRTINTHNVRHRGPAPIQKETSYGRTSLSLHPAPLPDNAKQCQPPTWKLIPPAPEITLSKVENGIVISWNLDSYHEDNYENIASYQIYAYQETAAPPSTSLWKKIGDVKALPLPMACTLTQFVSGYKYYFAVRAVDIRSRLGPFSLPSNIMLVNK
ncbi:uncharacterized protein PF11_0213 [Zerene cesonia]|uniref:uncharacterized protein PF11_0213 n=1 Tax=Zerene cesonia TaxID=33412 RepID=UPI0018E52571|nr:uncharacterized protein PF11_0213 [Zerene cesonia]XP_038223356.1 uncharacterized protein PF11_0213 [Zerene cesonia]